MKAFPNPHRTDELGMTLRDYFAAHSIQTVMLMVKHNLKIDIGTFYWHEIEREIVAENAYKLADAMMKAREA
jgi:hypothetical protein